MQKYFIKETWWLEGMGLECLHMPLHKLVWIFEIILYNLTHDLSFQISGESKFWPETGLVFFFVSSHTHRLPVTQDWYASSKSCGIKRSRSKSAPVQKRDNISVFPAG